VPAGAKPEPASAAPETAPGVRCAGVSEIRP
jgi:hypothetical protein